MDAKLPEPGIPEHWNWPNFTPAELRCKHTGIFAMQPAFLDRLQELRTELGFPFVITSGYRAPTHPVEAAKKWPGAHAYGRAVDIATASAVRSLRIVERARAFGFTGIGVSMPVGQLGHRFIHLDDMQPDEFHAVRPNFWSY